MRGLKKFALKELSIEPIFDGKKSQKIRVTIMASGRGSHAENIWNFIRENYSERLEVTSVITDQPHAKVIEKCERAQVPFHIVEKPLSESKINHEKRILEILNTERTEWVFLAGYMRILSLEFLKHFQNKNQNYFQVVNIHPSLLPAFKGAHAVEDAFFSGAKIIGATLHLVDEQMDHGPILMQNSFAVTAADTLVVIKDKNLKNEHKLYSDFLKILADAGEPGITKLVFQREKL